MSFGASFLGDELGSGQSGEPAGAVEGGGLLHGAETIELPEPASPYPLTEEDVREAHAAGKAHTAYQNAGAGSYPYPRTMNVVITFADAARVFAYRGLRAVADKLRDLADRIAPVR